MSEDTRNPAELMFSEKELAWFSFEDRRELFEEADRFAEKYSFEVFLMWRNEMRHQASIVWGSDRDPSEPE